MKLVIYSLLVVAYAASVVVARPDAKDLADYASAPSRRDFVNLYFSDRDQFRHFLEQHIAIDGRSATLPTTAPTNVNPGLLDQYMAAYDVYFPALVKGKTTNELTELQAITADHASPEALRYIAAFATYINSGDINYLTTAFESKPQLVGNFFSTVRDAQFESFLRSILSHAASEGILTPDGVNCPFSRLMAEHLPLLCIDAEFQGADPRLIDRLFTGIGPYLPDDEKALSRCISQFLVEGKASDTYVRQFTMALIQSGRLDAVKLLLGRKDYHSTVITTIRDRSEALKVQSQQLDSLQD